MQPKPKKFAKIRCCCHEKNGKTGSFYPNFECGGSQKFAWKVFAEARGGDLTIDLNNGEFVFIYLKL